MVIPNEKRDYKSLRLLLSILIIFYISSTNVQSQDETTYKIGFIEGSLKVKQAGSEGWLTVNDDYSVRDLDIFKTADGSRAEITDGSNSILRIGPQTEIELFSNSVILSTGRLWCEFHRKEIPFMVKSGCAFFDVSDATAGIIVSDDKTCEIKTYSGTISGEIIQEKVNGDADSSDSLSSTDQKPVRTAFNLAEGNKLLVSSKGIVVFRGSFFKDDIDELSSWISWNKRRSSIE